MKLSLRIIQSCCKSHSHKVPSRLLHESTWTKDSRVVNEVIIKDQLKALSVPFTDGYTCLHVKDCRLCSQSNNNVKNDTDIFINKKTGFLVCEHCKVIGNWNAYSGLLEKVKKGKVDVKSLKKDWERFDKDLGNWNEVVENTFALHSFNEEEYNNILNKFNLTHFKQKTCEKLKIRINNGKDTLYFPLRAGASIVGYKTYNQNGVTSTYPRNDCSGLLTSSHNWKSAVVVAKIPDFFALLSENVQHEIICLSYGGQTLPQRTLPFFEKYEKIILWLGEGSMETSANIAKKLNEKRCYVVRPIENQMSASFALSKKENLNKILKEAKLCWHQFVIGFNSLREEVLAELQNQDMISGVPWKKFPELTKILKGHRRGELTILTGPTGAGKTTFISEYSLDLAMQGVNTLWGSFEIKNSRLAKIMLTQFGGGPLSESVSDFNALCDSFEELPLHFLTFHGQQPLPTVMEAIDHCSYTHDIAHVIIDNVQFMIEVSSDSSHLDRFWKQDHMIQAFRSFASKNNCHVTLIMHPKKIIEGNDLGVNSIFGGVKASQEADNILIIQVKEKMGYGKKKFLQVCKNRYSGDLGSFVLNFNKESLTFSKINQNSQKQNKTKFNFKEEDGKIEEKEEEEEEEVDIEIESLGSKM